MKPATANDYSHLDAKTMEELGLPLPDHTDLPETDGKPVKNFQEHPQSILLTSSIGPVLERLYPDGQYCIGQDSGIYYRRPRPLEEPTRAAICPDWYLVPGRPPLLDGKVRRSYVMWIELLAPLLAIELASDDGSEERDRTVGTGKFWVYENVLRIPYYAIYEVVTGKLEVYEHLKVRYEPIPANERGHFPIPPLGVELGTWQGRYQNTEMTWLRWFDEQGNLLLSGEERAERARKEKEHAQAQIERLMAQLQALGVKPEILPENTK